MTKLSEFVGVVVRVDERGRGSWLRYREGEILLRGAVLPVSTACRFTVCSDSQGPHAITESGIGRSRDQASLAYCNESLTWANWGSPFNRWSH
jgi:hypothetical protein